jgi:hypothetical protein
LPVLSPSLHVTSVSDQPATVPSVTVYVPAATLLKTWTPPSSSENAPAVMLSEKGKLVPPAGEVDLTMRIVPVVGATTGAAIWPRIWSGASSSETSGPCTST